MSRVDRLEKGKIYKIISCVKNQFCCKHCKVASDYIYYKDNKFYCDNCCLDNKDKAIEINQNREILVKKRTRQSFSYSDDTFESDDYIGFSLRARKVKDNV